MKKLLSALLGIFGLFIVPAYAALPSGYTELEYIESTGTQYISLNLNNTTRFVVTAQNSALTTSNQVLLVGDTTANPGTWIGCISNGKWGAGVQEGTYASIDSTTKVTIDVTFQGTGGLNATINNETIERAGTTANIAFYLFATSNLAYGFQGKIFSLEAYQNGTLVRNFIPAKNSSGVVGMYDTVNNRFYTNAGTGEFIAGAPVTTCDGTVVNYVSATGTVSQSGTPTPDNPIEPVFYQQGNMVLRKVGDYADTYDASTGKITRRVGVKVLDGTESWRYIESNNNYGNFFYVPLAFVSDSFSPLCNYFNGVTATYAYLSPNIPNKLWIENSILKINASDNITTVEQFKSWIAQQYQAGTPVTVYYPLETETTEDWTETSYCSAPIKIATTKYNESAFGPLNTALANAISVVDSVVSNTITQAENIAKLQTQKQTRPADDPTDANNAENCPAGKKCLLVEDASGTPHWYEIVENASLLPSGYTQLEYVESTATQIIVTDFIPTWEDTIEADYQLTNLSAAGDKFLIGAQPTDVQGSGFWVETYDSANAWYVRYGSNQSATTAFYSSQTSGTFILSKSSFVVNGTRILTPAAYVQPVSPMSIFGRLDSNGRVVGAFVRFSNIRVKRSNVLTHNFVPAKDSSGKIGMYDTVNNRFYTNAGTGEFISGAPVAE